MRNAIKMLLIPALLLTAGAGAAQAQNGDLGNLNGQGVVSVIAVPPQTIITCPARWRTRLTLAGGAVYNFDATANGTFQATAASKAGDPAKSTQSVSSISASADIPELGTISWTLYSSATPTVISANQAGADFPATSNIYFTPQATISSRPGITYRAAREVHLQTTNLRTFNPQSNESYTVDGPVDFLDDAGNVAFTIELSNFTIG